MAKIATMNIVLLLIFVVTIILELNFVRLVAHMKRFQAVIHMIVVYM